MTTKTAVQSFIEDSLAGGWLKEHKPELLEGALSVNPNANLIGLRKGEFYETYNVYRILLDPLAWQAVGKRRGWPNLTYSHNVPAREVRCVKRGGGVRVMQRKAHTITRAVKGRENLWRKNWHRFIDALADGKSIEEALNAIAS